MSLNIVQGDGGEIESLRTILLIDLSPGQETHHGTDRTRWPKN